MRRYMLSRIDHICLSDSTFGQDTQKVTPQDTLPGRTVFCSGAGGCRADSWDCSKALRADSWDCLRSNCLSLSLIKFESVDSCCAFKQLSLTWHMASLLYAPSWGLCASVEVLPSQTPAGRSGGTWSAPMVKSLHWLITLLISALTR